ncbi:MAG: putative collagen-binding domain-containing protein [Chthoniobacteraceae bacterium]
MGPWTTVAYDEAWGDGHVEVSAFFGSLPNKWLSADGTRFTMVFTGKNSNDSWNAIAGRFVPSKKTVTRNEERPAAPVSTLMKAFRKLPVLILLIAGPSPAIPALCVAAPPPLDKIDGLRVKASWFDTRTGEATAIGEFDSKGTREFPAPNPGDDFDLVLVLGDAARKFPRPGVRKDHP